MISVCMRVPMALGYPFFWQRDRHTSVFFKTLEQKRVQVFLRLSEYYSFILLEI